MKRYVLYIFMMIVVVLGLVRGNGLFDYEVLCEKRMVKNSVAMIDDRFENTLCSGIQTDQVLIRPLEQYPFD